MADYTVSEAKLQELNVLIDKAGGQNTSEISNKHEDVVAVANTLPNSVGTQRSKIIKLTESAQGNNEVVGEVLSDMQKWHDDVAASGDGDEEPEPGPAPGPPPGSTPETPVQGADGLFYLPDLTPSTGNHSFTMQTGKRYTFRLAAEGSNTAYACPSGPCNCAAGASPGGTEIPGQPGADNAVILGKLPAGKWFTFWLGDGHSPQGTCLYSSQHYAT